MLPPIRSALLQHRSLLGPLWNIRRAAGNATAIDANSSIASQVLLKKLRHQSLKRGTTESSILLGTFAEQELSSLTLPELLEYQRMLEESDIDLFAWISGSQEPPPHYRQSSLLRRLQAIAHYQATKL